jgi:hypothetical protein
MQTLLKNLFTNTVISKKILPCPFLSLRLVRNPSEKERFLMSQWPTSGNDNPDMFGDIISTIFLEVIWRRFLL